MKPIFFTIIFSLVLIMSCPMVRAQSGDLPTPQPPYIEPVPDYGHWKVTFKYVADAPAAPAAPATPAKPPVPVTTTTPSTPVAPSAPSVPDGSPTAIETIKTGDLRGITLTLADGTTKEYTCQGNWVLCSTPKGPQLGIATPTAFPYPYYTAGFILLDGATISQSTFKETKQHNGVMAFHYKSGTTDIWIDPNTLLPLAAKKDGVEVTYQFLTPPPRPFPIPKDQSDLLQKERAASQATSSMR
jgi:hypothetical protein